MEQDIIIIYKDNDREIWCTSDGSQIEYNKGDSGCEIYVQTNKELEKEYNYFNETLKLSNEQQELLLKYLQKNLDYNLHIHKDITFKDIVIFLQNLDTPLGDLCYDILNDINFPFYDTEKIWEYLNNIRKGKDYLDDPIRRLKTIYSTIERS